MNRKTSLLLIIFLTALPAIGRAGEAFPPKLSAQPIQTQVTAFKGKGRMHAAYEFLLQNFGTTPLFFQAVELEGYRGSKKVWHKRLEGETLREAFALSGSIYLKPQTPALKPSEGGILFEFSDFPKETPERILSTFWVQEEGKMEGPQKIRAADVRISAQSARVIQAPLSGENWWSPNAPANNSIHRRIVVPIDGPVRVPERLAVDWVQLGPDGRSYQGPKNQNKSYFAYGKEVRAVADGKVVAVIDGIPENTPQSETMAVLITLTTIAGNYVMIDMGGGVYAFYAHLQPGSPAVKLGDAVKAGDKIGLLGNSGNSSEPHLHFHLIDAPDPLRGQGLPFVIANWERIRHQMVMDKNDDPVRFKTEGSEQVSGEILMNMELANFPKP